jgi:mediator of RNA polymerase II transcription subunit 13
LMSGGLPGLAQAQSVALHQLQDLQASQQQPVGAPTPVSPGPVGGGEIEDIEPLVATLAREAACNPLWARACRIVVRERSRDRGEFGCVVDLMQPDLGRNDLSLAEMCMQYLGYLTQDVGLHFSSKDNDETSARPAPSAWKATRNEEPQLCLGKSGSIVQLGPSVLRFWERFSLGPRAGPKDVTAYLLFEESRNGVSMEAAASWLGHIGRAYKVRGFPSFTAKICAHIHSHPLI